MSWVGRYSLTPQSVNGKLLHFYVCVCGEVSCKQGDMTTQAHASWIVQQARDAGWTLTAIANELGCSRRCIYNWMKGEGDVYAAAEVALQRLKAKIARERAKGEK